jgi:hypothetical protein
MPARTRGRTATEPAPGVVNMPQAGATMPTVPFCQGSKPETEVAYTWSGISPTASSQTLGPIALPANGYIRNVWIEVETTKSGKKGASSTAPIDAPFCIFEQIKLTEPNGAPLGMELKGYNAYLANVLGRYAGSPDPQRQVGFSGISIAEMCEPRFALRIPVELSPNGLGALGNQSASAALRLTLTIAPEKVTGGGWVVTEAFANLPTINVRVTMELWGEPPERDILGRAVQQSPPFEGTAQYWSEQSGVTVNAGNNNIRITRVGSMIRTLAFVFRKSSLRTEGDKVAFGGPATAPSGENKTGVASGNIQLQWDNRVFRTQPFWYNNQSMEELIQYLKERPKGVIWFAFSQGEGREAGEAGINSWLATLTSTRLELLGSAEEAGTVDIVVNDVSVTAINPLERTQQIGVGGYHPPVGQVSQVGA